MEQIEAEIAEAVERHLAEYGTQVRGGISALNSAYSNGQTRTSPVTASRSLLSVFLICRQRRHCRHSSSCTRVNLHAWLDRSADHSHEDGPDLALAVHWYANDVDRRCAETHQWALRRHDFDLRTATCYLTSSGHPPGCRPQLLKGRKEVPHPHTELVSRGNGVSHRFLRGGSARSPGTGV